MYATDRRYRLKTYKRCFLGSDAVKWMMSKFLKEVDDYERE